MLLFDSNGFEGSYPGIFQEVLEVRSWVICAP